MKKVTHSLFYAVVASAMLLPVLASQHEPIEQRAANPIRALLPTTEAITSANSPTSTQPATGASPTQGTTAVASTTPSAATSDAHSSVSSPTNAATSHATSAAASSVVTGSPVSTTTTDSAGNPITVIVTPTASSPPPSHTDSSGSSSGGGLNTGSIVGLSVAGGIAALGIILFFVWKFTRKRFSDFDDNEAIKWPELNAHNNDVHALPTNATGRAGFGPENDSDINLTRAPSPGGAYASSIANSVPDMYGTGDPYAVPPLPHLNPNQPYRDDPGTYGQPAGYYDPYRGPVPNTFDAIPDGQGTEAIPMTRMRSPAPQVAYDMQGRGSPAPQAAMGYPGVDERSRTPNPSALVAGRASPSPYGYGPR